MFVKKTFALLVATAAFVAPSVSAGNVRGFAPDDIVHAEVDVDVDSNTQRRFLKQDRIRDPTPAPNPPSPTLPPAPIPPPTPPSGDRLITQCDRDDGLRNCVRSAGASLSICSQCLANLLNFQNTV